MKVSNTIAACRSYPVSEKFYSWVQSITHNLTRADYKLFCHILFSTLRTNGEDRNNTSSPGVWIPLPAQFIQAAFRNANPLNLKKAGLIQITKQFRRGTCLRYSLTQEVLDTVLSLLDVTSPKTHNLLKWKKYGKALISEKITEPQSSCQPLPPLVSESIETIQESYFDYSAVLKHLECLKQTFTEQPTWKNRYRYLNDWRVSEYLLEKAKPSEVWPGIYTFKPTYKMLSTGRINALSQSASLELKKAMYLGIPDLHNYDLTAAQLALIRIEFERCQIDCPWLDNYIANPQMRQQYADELGIPAKLFKTIVLKVTMGAHIPLHFAYKATRKISIVKDIQGACDPESIQAKLSDLRKLLSPYLKAIRQWKAYLKTSNHSTNLLGLVDTSNKFQYGKRAAHLLQGAEAYFIHTLTGVSPKYAFKVIANEYDGVITLGAIPPEALLEVKQLTGLTSLDLREKPFD